jgi:hypothetical protein
VLTEFFCDKLEEETMIEPALNGLLALSKLPSFGTEEVRKVVDK